MSERGEYRAIARALIDGPDFQRLPANANHIFLLLKLNFGAAGIEVWYPDELLARLCRQSAMNRDQVSAALDILEREGWVKRTDNVVWIVGQLEFDPHMAVSNPKHRLFIARQVAGLPHIDLVREFVARNTAWFEGIDRVSNGIAWAFDRVSKGSRKAKIPIRMAIGSPVLELPQLPEQEPEQQTATTCAADAPPTEPLGSTGHWVRDGAAWWREHVGEIAEPKFGAMLKAAVDHHGWDTIFPALRFYAEHAGKYKNRSPKYFADEAARWIAEEADEHRLIGANGNEAEIMAYVTSPEYLRGAKR